MQGERTDGPRSVAAAALFASWREASKHRSQSESHDIATAHLTNALAQVLSREPTDTADALSHRRIDFRRQLLKDLKSIGSSTSPSHSLQATIQALGLTARPIEDEDDFQAADESADESRRLDVRTAIALGRSQQTLDDIQARGRSSIALAQQGGGWNERAIRRAMEQETLAVPKSWQALALGVIHRRALDAGQPLDQQDASELLLSSLGRRSEPGAAAAIALGLLNRTDAAPRLRQTLQTAQASDEYAAHLSVALGMLGDWNAAELLDDLLRRSHRRFERRLGAAHGLALIGDQSVPQQLFSVSPHLERPTGADASGVLRCLHDIGCVFVVDRLMDWLQDEARPIEFRAQTAAALGGIAEPGETRWHEELRRDLTASGAVPTLHYGVLDLW
ncbi:MAG: hypothetical protein AAF196_20515 [Planctomycetota bacterium]